MSADPASDSLGDSGTNHVAHGATPEVVKELALKLRPITCGAPCLVERQQAFAAAVMEHVGVFKEAVLAILAAIAKQERIRISERVQAGLSRARTQGKRLGRPHAAVRVERVLSLRDRGMSIREIAEETCVSAMTVQRVLKANGAGTGPRAAVSNYLCHSIRRCWRSSLRYRLKSKFSRPLSLHTRLARQAAGSGQEGCSRSTVRTSVP